MATSVYIGKEGKYLLFESCPDGQPASRVDPDSLDNRIISIRTGLEPKTEVMLARGEDAAIEWIKENDKAE